MATSSSAIPTVAAASDPGRTVQWGPAFAGAIAAAALASVLHGFAIAVGLAISSASPTWRDASFALWLLSGIYLVLVAIASYGVGGYIAGRMRARWIGRVSEETETRDGIHGLIVWGLATLATALLIVLSGATLTRLAAPSSGTSGPAASVGAENIVAYDLDRLFRSDRRPAGLDMTYSRAEAGRILLTASGHNGVAPDDRAYLVRVVGQVTGLPQAEAQIRVDTVIASAHDNMKRARRSAVILAFMAGAAAMVGASDGVARGLRRWPSSRWRYRSVHVVAGPQVGVTDRESLSRRAECRRPCDGVRVASWFHLSQPTRPIRPARYLHRGRGAIRTFRRLFRSSTSRPRGRHPARLRRQHGGQLTHRKHLRRCRGARGGCV